jgi:hypothetical protein
LVGFDVDVFDYSYFVQKLNDGTLPKFDVVPGGYPVFCYLVGLISNKTITIIIIQNVLSFSSVIFLLYAINRFYPKLAIPAAVIMAIFLCESFTIRYDNSLNPESIYVSSIITVIGLFIYAIEAKNKSSIILFSSSLILPALIRPNGIFIYFLLLFVLSFFLKTKPKSGLFKLLLIPFITLNLLWATYNYSTAGIFMIGYPTRVLNIFDNNPKRLYQLIEEDTLASFKPATVKKPTSPSHNIILSFYKNLNVYSTKKSPYYYSFLSEKYHDMYISEKVFKNYTAFDGALPVSEKFKKATLQEYYRSIPYQLNSRCFSFYSPMNESVTAGMNFSEVRLKSCNDWLFINFIIHLLYEKIYYSYLWLVVFISTFCLSLVVCVKKGCFNNLAFISLSLFFIHFVSLIVITLFHGYSQQSAIRYEYTTSYLVLLAPMFSMYYIINLFSKKSTFKDA